MKDISEIRANRFYDKLRKKVSDYCGKHSDIVLLAPDIFMLLLRLLKDDRVPLKYKGIVTAAVTYFISPIDIIPEALVGPFGYTDDIIIAVMVLNKIINETSEEVVVENWSGKGNILALIQNILTISNSILGKQLASVKKKLGL
ncbi:YkvA family protein [candidate division KSB1 bacterium]